MRISHLFLANALFTAASGIKPEVGKPLAKVRVLDQGELLLSSRSEVHYAEWDSQKSLSGKVRCIQVMGGSLSAKNANAAFIGQLTEAEDTRKLSQSFFQSTTIIDMRKCLFGTSRFVIGQLEQHKLKSPHASFVIDKHGEATRGWSLESDSSIIALNEKGDVFFVKDGRLSQQDSSQLINDLISKTDQLGKNASEMGDAQFSEPTIHQDADHTQST